ncbi:11891_t:CDS:1 [Acaulospora morrowiae]|uniref:11891_t:CDS:1 n=1 Tax=Acaulospora morrowiae TaxID=94023 RepID=A0A9N9I2S6_9GLOM|nr:11891_t:CDS:1 [Acaulospora morrowiae]
MEKFRNRIEYLEWALILNIPPQNDPDQIAQIGNNVDNMILPIVMGQYKQALTSPVAQQIFNTNSSENDACLKHLEGTLDISSYISARIDHYLLSENVLQELRQLNLLCVAAACLNAFVQSNWTGPILELEPHELLPNVIGERHGEGELNKKALEMLSIDGEDAYHLTPRALYLLFARIILVENESKFSILKSAHWWGQRILFIQQRILDNASETLHSKIMHYLQSFNIILPTLMLDEKISIDLRSRFYLEYGFAYHYYNQDSSAIDHFVKAQKTSGLKWKLTGELGKRTKFQSFDVSQLLIVAKSAESEDPDEIKGESEKKEVPKALPLDDDVLLEKIEFSKSSDESSSAHQELDPRNQGNLKVIDQCLLLAFCLNVKNTNPTHGITTEQMVPYVTRVLENPNNWMVYTMALLLRSRLEKERSRTIERSVLQLQALVDQFPLELSSAQERMSYFYQILLPSKWDMEKELAIQYLSLGVIRSALQIFERLEMWEDVINCYIMLEKEEKAREIINEQLKANPNSPKLHCLLGDIEKNPKHWEDAWEMSGHRYGRAMRSLGLYWYKQKDYHKSIECYGKALKINPIFENSWFIQGCAAMHVEDWETAAQAFTRVISINTDNSEAWNNLASAYLRQNRKTDAFNSFQQGLKQNYDNWKIWQNYMYTAIDIGEFSEAIRAMERVVDLRWKEEKESCVDLEVLGIIVNSVIQGIQDSSKTSATRLASRVEKLLNETITSRITSNPQIWQICAQFFLWKKDYDKSLEAHLKAYRSVLHNPKLETSEEVFKQAATIALEVTEAYQNLGELEIVDENKSTRMVCKDWRYQAKSLLKSLIGKTNATFEGHEMHDKLKETLKELNAR